MPETFADDNQPRAVWAVFGRSECTAENKRRAEQSEVRGTYAFVPELARQLAVLPVRDRVTECSDVLHNRVLSRPVSKLCRRPAWEGALRSLCFENDNTVGVGKGRRLQQDSVDKREDCSVCADADREGDDCRDLKDSPP